MIITSGVGWVQEEGGAIQEVQPGDVVWFPPGVKHWHGASPKKAMSHLAIQEAMDGKAVEWLEQVRTRSTGSDVGVGEGRRVGMPHVVVKLWPGKSQEQKQRLADAIAREVVAQLGCGEESVSVGFEEVSSADWKARVYDPEIAGKSDGLLKRPGYSM